MTPQDAFEAWWKEAYEHSTLHDKETARTFWLAACTWQRAQDAKVAEANDSYVDCGIQKEIATAIRQQS